MRRNHDAPVGAKKGTFQNNLLRLGAQAPTAAAGGDDTSQQDRARNTSLFEVSISHIQSQADALTKTEQMITV